jgi:hypothetical protein
MQSKVHGLLFSPHNGKLDPADHELGAPAGLGDLN